jgi:hypothetical protein
MTFPGLVAANNLSDVVDRESAWDNLGSSVSANFSIPLPSLDLNFAANKSLVDNISGNNLITFSRDSVGTFFDSNGLLQTAASGVPRFDHDPVTRESLGLLIEGPRTNLLLNSATLSTQSATVAAAAHALSFYGTGTVTLSGVSTAGPLVGTGANNRVSLIFTPTVGVLVLTVSGSVTNAQLEESPFPTSYIPTVASTVTRAADVVSIAGANFSSVFDVTGGTIVAEYYKRAPQIGNGNYVWSLGYQAPMFTYNDGGGYIELDFSVGLMFVSGANLPGKNKSAFKFEQGNYAATVNGGTIATSYNALSWITPTSLQIGAGTSIPFGGTRLAGPIARLAYYPARLPDVALQYLSSASGSPSSTTYPYTFTIKGKDTLALNSVSNASTRDFVFIKGLSTSAQPRLNTAAQQVASGTVFQDAAMLKASPTTSGNYFFSSGITLSGVSTRINGTPALSIATSPFSGSTATASILLRELQPQTNWRITEPLPSGTIASPEFAIPFETNDFVLFMKAGQS